jgi:BASS family bile acid:Na+ symporter
MMLLLLVVAPALFGRWVQTLIPKFAPKLGLWLGRLSVVIFITATVLGGSYRTGAIKLMGRNSIAVTVLLILGSWIVGWLMGGPEVRNRKVLAISSSMRNVGICLPIASSYFAGSDVALPVLAFSGFMIPMNMVFALILGRAFRDPQQIAATLKA